jgi:type II secretory pathway pseudopilin PulG
MSSGASDDGATVSDLLIVLVVISMVSALAAPAAASVIDATRSRQAAGFLSSRLRLARQEAVARGTHVGVVFDLSGTRWSLRVCRDGSRNGLRRADIQSGADPCFDGPHELGHLFPSIEIAVDATLRGPAGEPGSPDPVRFGAANLVSFSPLGSCTAGSLFFRSRLGAQYVVRVAGVTGRVRILRYETGAWTDQ